MLALPKPVRQAKTRKRVRKVKRTRAGQPSEKKLDDLARPLCRSRGVCEAAGYVDPRGHGIACSRVLQWSHIQGRTRRRNNLRWRMDNCLCLCSSHHCLWTRNAPEWNEFLDFKIGRVKRDCLEREALYGEKADRVAALLVLQALTSIKEAQHATDQS